jgi:hypothetical protein
LQRNPSRALYNNRTSWTDGEAPCAHGCRKTWHLRAAWGLRPLTTPMTPQPDLRCVDCAIAKSLSSVRSSHHRRLLADACELARL